MEAKQLMRTFMTLLGIILILAVACGTAQAPDPTAAPAAEPTATPVVSETSQPTAMPQTAAPPAGVEVHPGKLTIMVSDLANERFDRTFGAGTGYHYGRIIGGYLISDNEKKEMVPGIAEDWNLSADGLAWTFTIREGVKFHDGSDLTAEDVLWTLQHYYGPQALEYALDSSDQQRASRVMDRIELSGPDKVNVVTKMPIIGLGDSVAETGGQWFHIMPKRTQLNDTEEALAYDNNPVGAGPMSLKEHVPANVMRFERFDDFYYQPDNGFPEDKRVNFRSLDLFLVPEEATRVAALRSGEADIVPASLQTKEQVEAGGGRLVFGQEGSYVWARLFGCWEPKQPCHDKRVRQALDYALDKELIANQLYGGPEVFQVKGWSVVTPSTMGYTPELDPWPFDPEKARQLLADADYPGGEGFGKLIINTNPSIAMPFLVEASQLAADLWRRELGLDVEVKVGDDSELKKRQIGRELNGQIWWRDNETRTDPINSTLSNYGDPESSNLLHNDPELMRMVQETFQILDPDKRAEAAKKLYPRLRDESYELGVGYTNIPWAVGPRVLTWEPYPVSVYVSALHTITLK